MQLLKIISLSFILLNFYSFSNKACAKDLTHRFGIGLKNNTSESLPSIAAVYFPMAEIAVTGGFGMDTRKDNSRFQVHGGVRKIFFTEANLNFYTGAQFGLAQFETAFDGIQSGLEIHGVFGVEFFFQGLENLGFTMEAGLAGASVGDTRFRTVADDPTRAGIIFYF